VKTIYLLHTRLGVQSINAAVLAFECKECAEVQAAWYRRDRVPVTVIPVPCYEHLRDAQAQDCKHLKLSRPGRNSAHEHVPLTLDARKA
jgi:hypothetical protein